MCDTYVALSSATKDRSVIFGKNSDRPHDEAQLITYVPRTNHSEAEVQCTYISIPQVKETAAILMSQPFWIYGCEMGCSEHGIVIGNEAVASKEPLKQTGLLGMDLIRLGLERSKTAKEALEIITNLLEKYGQGGAHQQKGGNYHNSFIIADYREAFILETAGDWWVAEIVKDIRSISNDLSIRGKGDLRKKGIIDYAIEKDYCNDDNNFDFALTFSSPNPFPNYMNCSIGQLRENKGEITPEMMMKFLKEHDGNICRHKRSDMTTGSQISHLRKNKKNIHWFTGSMLTCLSIFKPYSFPIDGQIAMEAKTFKDVNPEWYWTKHAAFVKNFVRNPTKENPARTTIQQKISQIHNNIFTQINELDSSPEVSDKEFIEKIKLINNFAWKESENLIK